MSCLHLPYSVLHPLVKLDAFCNSYVNGRVVFPGHLECPAVHHGVQLTAYNWCAFNGVECMSCVVCKPGLLFKLTKLIAN